MTLTQSKPMYQNKVYIQILNSSHFHGDFTISKHVQFASFLGLNALSPQTKKLSTPNILDISNGWILRKNKIKKKGLKRSSCLVLLTSPDKFPNKHKILLSLGLSHRPLIEHLEDTFLFDPRKWLILIIVQWPKSWILI